MKMGQLNTSKPNSPKQNIKP